MIYRLGNMSTRLKLLYNPEYYSSKDTGYFNDQLTLEKLEHNYNLFYNLDLAHKYFKEEIVDPIYEFANK